MSRLDTSAGGGFGGGPRVVKPQANVYTVLVIVACLFVAAALAWELLVVRPEVQNPPAVPGAANKPAASMRILDTVAVAPIERIA
ncbi:MAG: hypothetical protein BIFFINMI_01519 [Phycisphaerae bacterium]|nr:hypothetical protein [Phycisphaerae bacterium]